MMTNFPASPITSPTTLQTKQRLDLLISWYCTLTLQSVRHIGQFYAPEVRFKDPFNDVRGVAAMMGIYEHMFDTTEEPRFVIEDRMAEGDQAFITWAFQFALRGKPYVIIGSTHLKFDADGLVILHRDYWDAAEELLQKLPVVGGMVRWLCGLFKTR